jgi:hypothetical protein
MYMSCKEGVPSHVLPESMNQNKSLTWITPKVLRSSAATPKLESERERERAELGKSEEELSATADRAVRGNDGGSCYGTNRATGSDLCHCYL